MRDIKFRGIDKELNVWIYGYYFYSELYEEHYIIGESKDYGYNARKVLPETVGQYTVLNDKNGVEIYEGDIVNIFDKNGNVINTLYIEWNIKECSYEIKNTNRNHYSFDVKCVINNCQVIGKIHNNKELLEANE